MTNLSDSIELLQELHTIDTDIQHLQRIGEVIASGDKYPQCVITVISPDQEKEPIQAEDEENSGAGYGAMYLWPIPPGLQVAFPEPDPTLYIRLTVNMEDATALEIMGVLMRRKLLRKEEIMKKLSDMGITLNA